MIIVNIELYHKDYTLARISLNREKEGKFCSAVFLRGVRYQSICQCTSGAGCPCGSGWHGELERMQSCLCRICQMVRVLVSACFFLALPARTHGAPTLRATPSVIVSGAGSDATRCCRSPTPFRVSGPALRSGLGSRKPDKCGTVLPFEDSGMPCYRHSCIIGRVFDGINWATAPITTRPREKTRPIILLNGTVSARLP